MRKISIYTLMLVMMAFTSCDLLKQAAMVATLAKCEFRLQSIKNLTLAGVNIQNIKSLSNLSMINAAKVSAAFLNKSLPLSFTLNVQAKNPNASAAGLSRLDWILAIDNRDMINGILNQQINISPNGGIATIPLNMNLDLVKLFNNQTLESIAKIVFGLVGANDVPTKITLRGKPTINVNGVAIQYPGYININTNFTSL